MRDANGSNGMLLKIALGIAGSLCAVLLGLIMSTQADTATKMAEQGERLARLETKVDMLLQKAE